MLAHLAEILKVSKKGGFALGAFNTYNLETTQAIIRAAVSFRAPLIVQVSENTMSYAGLKPITQLVKAIAHNESGDIPIVLHLDHGRNFQTVMECVRAGFSSIHIDGSMLPYEENVAITREAVKYSHAHRVWAQGELGKIMGVAHSIEGERERESAYTDPEKVADFVKNTEVDTLAISIGNSHGLADDDLDFPRLRMIKKNCKVPLVLHGGSGIRDDRLKKAIKDGINIINIDTELRIAFCRAIKEFIKKDKDVTDPRRLLAPARQAAQREVERYVSLFGAVGKAVIDKK